MINILAGFIITILSFTLGFILGRYRGRWEMEHPDFCWRLTKINQGYKMTRVEGQEIAERDLSLLERIRYWKWERKNTIVSGWGFDDQVEGVDRVLEEEFKGLEGPQVWKT